MNSHKLSVGLKIGYGFGGFGESLAYSFFYFFFIIFLTNVAGLNPGTAGLISFIAVLWDAVTDPLVGFLSDISKNKYGRRRPFILRFAVPLGIVILLLFTNLSGAPEWGKVIWFIAMNILFWTFFTLVDIPYISLGAELTSDYGERNSIRAYYNVFNYLAVIAVSSGLVILIGKIAGDAMWSPAGAGAWQIGALVLAVLTSLSFIICWRATRGKEPLNDLDTADTKPNFFKEYKDALNIKSYRFLLALVLLGCMGMYTGTAVLYYYFGYNLHLNEMQSGTAMLVYSIGVIILSPIVSFTGTKLDKKKTIILFYIIAALLSFMAWFITSGMVALVLALISAALMVSTFFILAFSAGFDICEIDELEHGKRREGTIMSFFAFIMKVGTAAGMWLGGTALQFFGFDGKADMQSAHALFGIKFTLMVIPAILYAAAALVFIGYPLSAEKFKQIQASLAGKKREA